MAEREGMLSPYRVLDLADEKGLFCGKLLSDLGADVIKIEKPGGDPSRNIGPFYHDEPDPKKSLFWFSYNTNKRSITLNIEKNDGKEIFRKLVKTADFVIESFSPGYMDALRLGYKELEQINPGVIHVSVTPFGQTGPYKDYKAPDIVAWAMGGEMYSFGDADRPPTRVSHHSQSYLLAGGEAAVGGILALYNRIVSGEGQHVDVSIQECVARSFAQYTTALWDMEKIVRPRGIGNPIHHIPDADTAVYNRTFMWPCKDGYVTWIYWVGPMAIRLNAVSIKWMESLGMKDDFLHSFDASTLDWYTIPPDVVNHIEDSVRKFFATKTKAELLKSAMEHGVMLYPVSNAAEVLNDDHRAHLDFRGFWTKLEHPELGTSLTYPGAFGKLSDTPPRVFRRAPLIGEHNTEIYEAELGLSRQQLVLLKNTGVI